MAWGEEESVRRGVVYRVLGHLFCTSHGHEINPCSGRCPVGECPVRVAFPGESALRVLA